MKKTTTIYVAVLVLSVVFGSLSVLRTDAISGGVVLRNEIHAIQRSLTDLEQFILVSLENTETLDATQVAFLQRAIRSIAAVLSPALTEAETVSEQEEVADQPTVKEISVQQSSDERKVPVQETFVRQLDERKVPAQETFVQQPVTEKKVFVQKQQDVSDARAGDTLLADAIARAVHSEVNSVRRTHGLSLVTNHSAITSVTLRHSIDMQNNDYFAHINLQGQKPLGRFGGMGRLSRVTGCYSLYSENLALLTTGDYFKSFVAGEYQLDADLVAERIVQMWMESTQGHRENMLMDTHRLSGIGVSVRPDQRGVGYRVYVTQNFCS